MVLADLQPNDPLREKLEEIKGAGSRAAEVTHQLLAFSRKQILKIEVFNLNEVITSTIKMLGRLIGEDVEIQTVFEPDLMQVKTDPSQMEQAVMNLAINARDAMPNGGKLTIETANVILDETYAREHDVEMKPGPYVVLTMSDTGQGMDQEIRSRLFEPFFTTKENGKGTGLGLSMVYGIVRQSDGFIWVYSEPGQGTVFKIYLPAVKERPKERQRESISLKRLKGSETVLVVEDDQSLLKLARQILKIHGYKVFEAANGADALRICQEYTGPINLLIIDVIMPGMSGREAANRIISMRPEIKVLYMSGYTNNAIAHHGVLDSKINFIEKPFSPENLARKVRQVLDQQDDRETE